MIQVVVSFFLYITFPQTMIFWCTYNIFGTMHMDHNLKSYWELLSQASKKFAMEEQGAFDLPV